MIMMANGQNDLLFYLPISRFFKLHTYDRHVATQYINYPRTLPATKSPTWNAKPTSFLNSCNLLAPEAQTTTDVQKKN